MKIIPTGKRLYVEFDPVEEKLLKSGLYAPRDHSELTRLGTVLAVGPDVDQYAVGDRFMTFFMSGTTIYFPEEAHLSETHRIVSQENILCKIEE